MRERNFTKGDAVEARLDATEATLQRFSRRLHKTVIGVIPPTIVFEYVAVVPEDGVLLRAILPGGTLTKGFMHVEKYADAKLVDFLAEVHKVDGSMQTRAFSTRKSTMVIAPDLPVDIGDRLVFKVTEPLRVAGIWIGFLFQVTRKDSAQDVFVLDQLEALAEKNE